MVHYTEKCHTSGSIQARFQYARVINVMQVFLTHKLSKCVISLVNVAYGNFHTWLVTNVQNFMTHKEVFLQNTTGFLEQNKKNPCGLWPGIASCNWLRVKQETEIAKGILINCGQKARTKNLWITVAYK